MAHYILRFIASLTLALTATLTQAQEQFQVQPGDTLVIEVLEDASLNRSITVLPDGQFNFPFAGSLRAAGKTVSQVQATITAAIAGNFASTPTVFVTAQPKERPVRSISDVKAATIDVYFLGEVAAPGLREVAVGTTFLQAMAQSGGLTRFAATKRIQLRRNDSRTGQQTVQSFNYKELANGAALSQDTRLRDGDIILVPERRLFE